MIAAKRREDVAALIQKGVAEHLLADEATAAEPAKSLLACVRKAHASQRACIATEFKRASPSKGPINTDVPLAGMLRDSSSAPHELL